MPTATFTANFMVSLQNAGKVENQMRQGFMAGDGGSGDSCRWAGFCGYNYTSMNTTLNGMIIDGVTMSMTSSSYGLSNSYALNLYKAPFQAGTNNSFLVPNDYNPQAEIYALSSYFTTPEFARNDTHTFSLPLDYLQHIRNGYLIACYRRTAINTPTNSHYTRGFEAYPTLTVTYHAPVSDFTLDKTTVDAGQVITANITASDTDYSHRITWKLNDTYKSSAFTIPSGSSNPSYAFTVPFGSGSPATNNWCTAIPNSTIATCTCTVETLDGSTVLGSKSKTFTMTVPTSVKPTIDSLTAALVDGYSGLYLQNRSKATLTANNPQGAFGSTIVSYSIGGGTTNPYTTPILTTSGSTTFYATVTDSRGRTSDQASCAIAVTAYARPRILQVRVERASDSAGTLSDEGTYAKCSIWYTWTNLGTNTNSTTVSYRENGTANPYAGDTTQGIPSGGGGFAVLGSGTTFDILKSYDVKFVFSDGTGDSDFQVTILYKSETFFDWNPVIDGACFGGFATRANVFEIAPTRKLYAYGEQIGVPSNPNLLINPDFQVWQRGTSFTSTGSARYTADRWLMSSTLPSVSKINDGVRIQFTTAWQRFQQSIEGRFSSETKVTCSTVMKSSSARPLSIYLYADGNAVDGLPISATTSYAIFSKSFTIPSNTASVSVVLQNTTTLTSDVDVQYIKLEMGVVATPNSPRPFPQELLMSQRYCQTLVPIRIRASNITTGYIDFPIPLVAPMRIVPTLPNVLSVCTTAGSAQTGFTFSIVTSDANFGYLNVRATKASHGLSDAQVLISPTGFLEADF